MTDVCESDVESYLKQQVTLAGGVYEKFKSPQKANVPDDITLWRATDDTGDECPAEVVFVECKRPGKEPTAAQARDHDWRRKMGFRVYVIDCYAAVDDFIARERR